MLAQEGDDFQRFARIERRPLRLHEADDLLQQFTVDGRRVDVHLPEALLREGGEGCRRVPEKARVLVRVTIKAAHRRPVVGVKRAARELLRGAVEQLVQQLAVIKQAQLRVNRRQPRRDAQIVLGKIDYITRLRVVEAPRVEQLAPAGAFRLAHRLPHGIGLQVEAEVTQRLRGIKLRESRALQSVF